MEPMCLATCVSFCKYFNLVLVFGLWHTLLGGQPRCENQSPKWRNVPKGRRLVKDAFKLKKTGYCLQSYWIGQDLVIHSFLKHLLCAYHVPNTGLGTRNFFKNWVRNSITLQEIYNMVRETIHMFITTLCNSCFKCKGNFDENMGLNTDELGLEHCLCHLLVGPSKSFNRHGLKCLYLKTSENTCILWKTVERKHI